jgi:hypothetical protein
MCNGQCKALSLHDQAQHFLTGCGADIPISMQGVQGGDRKGRTAARDTRLCAARQGDSLRASRAMHDRSVGTRGGECASIG